MSIDLHHFVTEKAQATCFYIEGMLKGNIPFSEVSIFIWDSLEEWLDVKADSHPVSEQEKVLWHLFHLMERWPESALRGNPFLRKQLTDGIRSIKEQSAILLDCPGIRP